MTTAAFMALDARSIRPYLLPLLATSLLGTIASQFNLSTYPTATLSITATIITMLVSSFLFSLDERSGLDTMYGLARSKRPQVVSGRYASLLAAAAVSTLLGALIYPFTAIIRGIDPWAGLPEAAVGVMCGMGWLIAIQVPVCLRWGYTKARLALFIAAFAIIILVMSAASILQFSTATEGAAPWGILLAAVTITALGLYASRTLAIRWYSRREL